MRYNEILNEQSRDIYVFDDVVDFFLKIKSECSQYLEETRNSENVLYRGLKGTPDIISLQSRNDRMPTDSSLLIQKLIDNWLKDNDYSVLRSNSYFCSSSYSRADDYGYVYFIFPKNGYQYLWFENSRDLYMHLEVFYKMLAKNIKKSGAEEVQFADDTRTNNGFLDDLYKNEKYRKLIEETIDEFMWSIKARVTDLEDAMDGYGEIMLTGSYCGIRYYDVGVYSGKYNIPKEFVPKLLTYKTKEEISSYFKTAWIKNYSAKNPELLEIMGSVLGKKANLTEDINLDKYLELFIAKIKKILSSSNVFSELVNNNIEVETAIGLCDLYGFFIDFDKTFKTNYYSVMGSICFHIWETIRRTNNEI